MRKESPRKHRSTAAGREGVESAAQARVVAEEGRAETAEAASESGDWRGQREADRHHFPAENRSVFGSIRAGGGRRCGAAFFPTLLLKWSQLELPWLPSLVIELATYWSIGHYKWTTRLRVDADGMTETDRCPEWL